MTATAQAFDLFSLPREPAKAPPSPVLGRIPLRWYQRQDVDAMMHAIESGRTRPACVAATGLGKGAVIAEMVGRLRPNGKVVWLVDRAHLVHQLADEIERHLPNVHCGRVADGVCDGLQRPVVVATVQAMYTPDRSGRPLYMYPHFDKTAAVGGDEAHRFFADCYRGVLEHFRQQQNAVIPLLTATPVASNGARWESFVDWTAGDEGPCMRTVGWGVRNGYLVPMRQAFVTVNLDLTSIYSRLNDGGSDPDDENAGDELADVLTNLLSDKGERAAASFASGVAETIGTRRTIVFSPPRVEAAKLLASWLKATGSVTCEPIWGAKGDKFDLLERFRRGSPQCLTNVNLLCEGVNVPEVSAVFICRLLKNWRMVQQMVGRALRPDHATMGSLNHYDEPDECSERRALVASSGKQDALIADLVGLDGKVLQASAVDVLYSNEPDDVRAEMGQILGERCAKPRPDRDGEDPDDATLEAARERLLQKQNEQLAEMARRRAMAGDLQADVSVTFNGRGGVAAPTVPVARAGATLGEKAFFVAVATQYDVDRAMGIADRTPRHQLKGMTFSMKKKLESGGGRPDWRRARTAYPEWAAVGK